MGLSHLDFWPLSGTLSDMRQVNAREFQKAFCKVAEELGQGETVTVTKHGKLLGFFTKAPAQAPSAMPDFEANLAGTPFIGAIGDRIMSQVTDNPLS
jgi:hypothetical protein